MEIKPNITDFSHELLCHILKYLPLREILSVAMLCKKMLAAVDMHLQLCKSIDFCQDSIFGYMPSTITDDHLLTLLKKCPHLEIVYGLHPIKIERRRLRKRAALTIPGIIEALSLCLNLKAIETSDLRLFEAIMQHLPQLEIIGNFQNRNGLFPPQASQRLKLQPYPRISSLHLIGVEVPELTAMPHLQHLHLQCVRFTKLQPFRAFLAQNLKSFVMKHCIGPSVPQRYLSLIIALSSSPNLNHLELVRVPLLNGLFQRAVEDSYRHNGFVNLRTLVISGCKGILEADLGHLMIVASKNLETLYIQPSLTKDSLFVSLAFAQCSFPVLRNLHLGYIDNLNSSGEWSNDTLLSFGLAEVPDTPSSLTDSGMKIISRLFPHIKSLSVSNCPHLMVMYQWMAEGDLQAWSKLTDLTLQKCHCLQLSSFVLFISFLLNIQVVILNDMFREPPKGCSHVGLSAGTGLGMSSAVVSNQDEHIAVQGHHQEFEPPGDEENEEIDREFIDVENEDNPEPQFMVLQRDFFDGEDNEGAIGNPSLENDQDPDIEEQGLNITFNEINNNSFPDENIISDEIIFDDSLKSPSSVSDKCVSSKAFTNENQSHNINESKYCLRNTSTNSKSSKSGCVQRGILSQDNCYSADFNEKKDIESKAYDNECCNSENNSQIPIVSEDLHKYDYDPHKPSTSKAGSHLDYSDWDDDYNYNKGTKRSNKYLNSKKISKKQKKSLKVSKDVTVDEKSRKDCKISSQNNLFENSLNNHSDFREEVYSNCAKEELSENILCDAQRNSNGSPTSFNTDKIPKTMPCYVLVKEMVNKDDKTVEVDNLSRNVSCCDCFHDDKYKNTLNDVKERTCTHVMPSKNTDNDVYSEKSYPFVGNENECPDLITNRFNVDCKTKASSDCTPEINEARIYENTRNMSISKSDYKIPTNCSLVSNFDFTDELSEKKLDINDVYELSEHEILLDGSFNESTEEAIHKVDVSKIPTSEKVTTDADMLHSSMNENSSVSNKIEDNFFKKKIHADIQIDSLTANKNSVATQTYLNDQNDNDPDIKNISLNENETLIHTPMNKSLEEFKSDLHKSEENLFIKKNSSKEITSENIKVNNSLESSKIIKPCCVLVTKIENIHTNFVKYSVNENENREAEKETPYDYNFEQATCDYFPVLNEDKNLEMCVPLQPSTSKTETDICNNSRKHSKTLRKMHSSKYFKRSSPINAKSENLNFNNEKASLKNDLKYCPPSETQNIKNTTESNAHFDISECSTEFPTHNPKRLKISPKVDQDDDNFDEDNKFFVSMPNDNTLVLFNSVNGNCYQIPYCRVVVTQMSNKNYNDFQNMPKCKDKQVISISQNSCVKRCDLNLEFNPHLPSTSRAGSHLNNISENVTHLHDKCKIYKRTLNHKKCFKSENLSNCCCLGPQNFNTEKLRIKNSEAMILLKQCNMGKIGKHNTCQQILSPLGTNDTSSFENETYNSCWEQKFSNEPNAVPISENSYGHKIDNGNIVLGNQCSSSFEEKTNSTSSSQKKKRRKKRKIIAFFKRMKKSLKDSKVKINNFSRVSTKNNIKRTTVPMISLISQGTQATSADIRRSVRRIRNSAAHRRTVPFIYMPKSRCSSKISAKALTKRPVSVIPRPESHDKATSTSDPLLEDDAVQTLQLSSNTLLSFTLMSCGISDLIIDRCPKLIHIEVQACRIMKSFQFNNCPAVKRLNISQCPKLDICAVTSPVMSLSTDSYILVSYEPCMQGYHPGDGEKAIIEKTSINQSVLLLHDFCEISYDGIQAKFREKIMEWLRFLSQLNVYLNYAREKVKKETCKSEVCQSSEYPWSHDLRKLHGHYSYSSSSSDFCDTEGRYQLLTNNPIFCDIFETSQLDTEFPDVTDCAAFKDPSLISYEAIEKYLEMQKKFIAFYIPITESNQINF